MSYGTTQQENTFGLPTPGSNGASFLPKQTGVLPTTSFGNYQNNGQPGGTVNTGGQFNPGAGSNSNWGNGLTTPPTAAGDYTTTSEYGGYAGEGSYNSGTINGGGGGGGGGVGNGMGIFGSPLLSTPGGNPTGMAAGGVVPEPGQQQGPPDVASAVQTAKQVLAHGRQKHGLPPVIFGGQTKGYADGGDVTEGGDMGAPAEEGLPQPPDAQPSPDQSAGALPGAKAASVFGYLRGTDAVTPEVAQAMQAQIDPRGQMDPNTRTLMSVAGASPQAQWGVMQHFRQKYDAYNAFAQAAANGTPGKPPDIMASTHAATQAQANLPDGNHTMFVPHPNGVQVHVQPMAAGKTKGYEGGGDVTDDSDDVGPQQDTPLPTPDPRGSQGRSDDSVSEPDTDALSAGASAVNSFVISAKDWPGALKKMIFDRVNDMGVQGAISSPDADPAAMAQQSGTQPPAAPSQGVTPAIPNPEGFQPDYANPPERSPNTGADMSGFTPPVPPPEGFKPDYANPPGAGPNNPSPTPAAGAPQATGKTVSPAGKEAPFRQPNWPQNGAIQPPASGETVLGRQGEELQRMPNGNTRVSLKGDPNLGMDPEDVKDFQLAQKMAPGDPVTQRSLVNSFVTARRKGASDVATETAKGEAWTQKAQTQIAGRAQIEAMKEAFAGAQNATKDPARLKQIGLLSAMLNSGITPDKIVSAGKDMGLDVPSLLSPKVVNQDTNAPAAAQQPQAPKQKPLAVTQNGHTYNLQPDGSYK